MLVDGNSTDGTKQKMLDFQSQKKSYKRIVVLDNPKKTLPCGWNVALDEAKGDAIELVDEN